MNDLAHWRRTMDTAMILTQEPFDPSRQGWVPDHEVGFMQIAGPAWQRRDGQTLRLGLLTGDRHANRNGVVHGGVILALIDHGLGMISLDRTGCSRQATISLNVQFVSPAIMGDFLELDADVIRQTRSIVFLRGTLRAGSRVVATADGIWKILDSQRRQPIVEDRTPA
ncbi:MAG: PaaI family thioesterase [Microvirga sp.]